MAIKNQHEYNKDFYEWAIYNAQLLREGDLSKIDVQNIAEEMESMGKSEKRELINRLAILMAHLLKWKFQPTRRGNSWKYTVKEQRMQLLDLLEESPSLKKILEEKIEHAYKQAVLITARETGLNDTTFPKKCPFPFKKIISHSFFPE